MAKTVRQDRGSCDDLIVFNYLSDISPKLWCILETRNLISNVLKYAASLASGKTRQRIKKISASDWYINVRLGTLDAILYTIIEND